MKMRELQTQATFSNLGLQVNQLRQEKIAFELNLAEQSKANGELKAQITALASARPSLYLDTEHDDFKDDYQSVANADGMNNKGSPTADSVESLRLELASKDSQIVQLQSILCGNGNVEIQEQVNRSATIRPDAEAQQMSSSQEERYKQQIATLQAEKKAMDVRLKKLKEEIRGLELANEKEVGKLGTENDFLKQKVQMCEQRAKEYEEAVRKGRETTGGEAELRELLLRLKAENEALRRDNKQKDDLRQSMEEKLVEMKVRFPLSSSPCDRSSWPTSRSLKIAQDRRRPRPRRRPRRWLGGLLRSRASSSRPSRSSARP